MSEDTVELSEVESFSYLFKSLWAADTDKRHIMYICDTILYKNGRPARWLFTNGDGEVMKRKDENLNTQEIVRMFKSKSTGGAGVKDHRLKSKIATVWFVNTKNQIQGYLVDDLQLRSVLSETLSEVLAVQLYIGGHNLKGSGIFEHRLFVRNSGATVHKTHELVSMHGNDLNIYSPNVERLVVTESQHTALKQVAKRVATRLEKSCKGQVANMVMQVVFTTAWVPILVSVRSLLLWHPDSNLVLYRNASLYAMEPPVAPSHANPGSVLLPHEKLSYMETGGSSTGRGHNFYNTFKSTAGQEHGQEASHSTTQRPGPGANPDADLSRDLLTQEEKNEKELSDMFDVITGTAGGGDSSDPSTAALHARLAASLTGGEGDAGTADPSFDAPQALRGKGIVKNYDDADLYFKDATHQNARFLNGGGRRPLGASAKGVHFPAALPVTAINARKNRTNEAPENRVEDHEGVKMDEKAGITRRGSTMAIAVAKAPQDAVDAFKFRSTTAVMPGERDSKKNKGAIHKNAAYGQTESSRTRLDFYQNQLKDIEEMPADKLLKNRRPISAPHNGGAASKSSRGVGVEAGGHGVSGGGARGSGFTKKAPLMSGTVCFGDYCFLAEFEPVCNEIDPADSGTGGGGRSNRGGPGSPSSPPKDPRPASPSNLEGGGGRRSNGGSPVGEEKNDNSSMYGGGNAEKSAYSTYEPAAPRTDGGSPPASPVAKLSGTSALSEHDLRPALMKFQLPFRSVLTMRSEEDYLKTKLYEDWHGDTEVEQAVRDLGGGPTFRIPGHEKKLLDITLRHLRRVGYCCLNDVRRTVVPMPAPHEPGSGFNSQWKALQRSYRKHIYVDALSKTHPSRFYQTIPVCDTCQFIYSMADQHREELVMGQQEAKPKGVKTYKPRVTSTGIRDAREKGQARRLAAETAGQERQNPQRIPQYNNYADPADLRAHRTLSASGVRGGRSSKVRHETHDYYDDIFDQTYTEDFALERNNTYIDGDGFQYELPPDEQGHEGENGNIQDADSKLARRLKAETACARDTDSHGHRPVQIGISTEGGAISSWVRVLTEPENTPMESIAESRGSSGGKAGRRPQSAAPTSSTHPKGRHAAPPPLQEEQSGKPNPMGPLAGQGIGGPLGQYRGFSAPVGNMLGQSSGDVGSTFIDSKGNFLEPKRRSPSDRGTGTGTGTSEGNAASPHEENELENEYEAGEGIAFGLKSNGVDAADAGAGRGKHEAAESHFLSKSKSSDRTNKKGSARGSRDQDKKAVRPGTAGVTRTKSKESSKSPLYESAESYKVGYPNRGGPSGVRPKSASAYTSSSKHLQNQLHLMQGRHAEASENSSSSNLLNIEAYTYNARTSRGTVSAMDLALNPTDLSTGDGRKTGNACTIDEFRFDVTAPYFPIDGINVAGTAGNTRSGDYKKEPAALQDHHRQEFAQFVPQQAVYRSSGANSSFEEMLKSSVKRLDEQAVDKERRQRPKAIGNMAMGVTVGSKERLRRSQELQRLQVEREEEEAREIGYLGGMNMDTAVRTLSGIYTT